MNSLFGKVWYIIEFMCHAFFQWICKLMHKELAEDVFETWMQFIKFGIVGLSNTCISYFLYAGSLSVFQYMALFSSIDYLIAQFIAFVLSVLWSFYWNNKIVFTHRGGKRRPIWKALIKTYISYSFTGLFLNSVLLVLWVQVCRISEYIAPIINLLVSVPINFVMNKFWAFRE